MRNVSQLIILLWAYVDVGSKPLLAALSGTKEKMSIWIAKGSGSVYVAQGARLFESQWFKTGFRFWDWVKGHPDLLYFPIPFHSIASANLKSSLNVFWETAVFFQGAPHLKPGLIHSIFHTVQAWLPLIANHPMTEASKGQTLPEEPMCDWE